MQFITVLASMLMCTGVFALPSPVQNGLGDVLITARDPRVKPSCICPKDTLHHGAVCGPFLGCGQGRELLFCC
ncbi:hypothetical protein M3J09_009172 [Ascochyta lentis]